MTQVVVVTGASAGVGQAPEFRRVTEVNYLGTVHGTLAALRHMRAHGRGAITQVGSALAYRGISLQSAYCASKHAIQGFNDSLRAELLHDCPAVSLSMVQLPAVSTPQFSWVRTRLPRHPQPDHRPDRLAGQPRPARATTSGTTAPTGSSPTRPGTAPRRSGRAPTSGPCPGSLWPA